MTAPAVTNTFTSNTLAQAGQVNTNFSDLVTYVSNRNDGSATWDRVLVTSASAVPFVSNNSTGTSNIANFQDNGTNVFQILDGGNVYMNATARLYLDGGGDTYLFESSANTLLFVAGNVSSLAINASNVSVQGTLGLSVNPTGKLYLDGGADTYMNESSANVFGIVVGGTTSIQSDTSGTATHTRLLIYDVDNATLERVTVGIADSGGVGFKVLRIPN